MTYALIRKGFEVAYVDHVGADLIAERKGRRIAVSVKTRFFKPATIESRGIVIESAHLDKLQYFADRFQLESVFAHVVSIADDSEIHLFMLRVADIKNHLDKVKHGYSLRFSKGHLPQTLSLPYIDYSVWRGETIGTCL